MSLLQFLVLALVGWTAVSWSAGYPPEPAAEDLKACENDFQYKGKLINPRVIELFKGWPSDTGLPTVTSVDIAAAFDTNQFYEGNVEFGKRSAVSKRRNEAQDVVEEFSYRWVGRTENGTHVVETTEAGEGSYRGKSLFFFKCGAAKGLRPAGKNGYPQRLKETKGPTEEPYSRLLLTVEAYYVIGDRVLAEYEIKRDSVRVKFPGKKPVELRVFQSQ